MSYKGFTHPDLLITPEALHDRVGDPSLCVVDVRPTHSFACEHIPGAVHVDLYGINVKSTAPDSFESFMAINHSFSWPGLLG